ncbi:MAG: SurA N-terminal domain-containing protein [Candidatus Eiseniibacteriota bacterium]|nr:MAG: SurA N-terminal domain-containing protein [Candidatus Eisenbacteria bacterium]
MFLFERLRKGTKVILWITIFAFVGFIFLVWGMDIQQSRGPNPTVIGKVNGQRIQTSYFRQILLNSYEQLRKERGGDISESDEDRLQGMAWDRIVNETLIAQEIGRRRISVSDAELEFYIRHSPPPEVAESPAFQTDGEFDPAKYRDILQNPAYDLTGLEAIVRATVPIRKLEELVAASAKVSNNEVRAFFEKTSARIDFSFVSAGPRDFSVNPESIPVEELRAFYEANSEEFRIPESANLRYIVLNKDPSAQDESEVLAAANDISREARAGTDFGELAQAFSQGAEAEKGGDIGRLLPRESIPPAEAEVLFSLEPGQVSSPVRDKRGYVIVKLEEKKLEDGVEKVRYRRIFLPVDPGSETLAELQAKAMEVMKMTSDLSLREIAQEMNLELKESGLFYKGGISPILPREEEVKEFPFKNKVGKISKPIETRRAWYFLEIFEKQPSYVPTFEQAEVDLRRAVVAERKKKAAHESIEAVTAALAQGKSLEQAAREAGLTVREAKAVGRFDAIPEVGREPSVIGAALALGPGDSSGVLEGDSGFFLVSSVRHVPLDEELFVAQKEQMKLQLLQQKRILAISMWLEQLRNAARIEDYRADIL